MYFSFCCFMQKRIWPHSGTTYIINTKYNSVHFHFSWLWAFLYTTTATTLFVFLSFANTWQKTYYDPVVKRLRLSTTVFSHFCMIHLFLPPPFINKEVLTLSAGHIFIHINTIFSFQYYFYLSKKRRAKLFTEFLNFNISKW